MQLEGYSNLVKIGEGGMAHVYRGTQDSLQRAVAIKLLINDLGSDDEARRRFERESYIIARLNHGNIIHVIDRGLDSADMPYFVMEYVEGTDLSTTAKMRKLTFEEKIEIIIQLLKALSYAHKNNVIHRDIKPDNILLDHENTVKILDFGIAQFYEDQSSSKTCTGTIMGTYNYMSPEQRKSSDNVTQQSDLYSVGVVMYELFTGKIPIGHFPEPSKINQEVVPELDKLILACLNSDPSQRPVSAEQLKTQLLALSRGAHINVESRLRAEQGITQMKSKFLLLDILREDKFGAVYLYQQKQKGQLLIIKKKLVDSSGFEANNLLASLEHPNIVKTLGTSRSENNFILVQEYMSGGTLQDKLAFQLSWQVTLNIATQICQAIVFAHTNRIVHGHLRPTNILFSTDGMVKLTDFSTQDDVSNVRGAHFYHLHGEARSQSGDIYACGVVLYQLLIGCMPRREGEKEFFVRKDFTRLPADIQALIANMLSTVPQNRHPESLQQAIVVFETHLSRRRNKSFTEVVSRDKRRTSKRRKEDRTQWEQFNPAALSGGQVAKTNTKRRKFLFAALVIVFAQYLFFFDGQEKFNRSMPAVYSQLMSSVEGILGSVNVRRSNTTEDSRFF